MQKNMHMKIKIFCDISWNNLTHQMDFVLGFPQICTNWAGENNNNSANFQNLYNTQDVGIRGLQDD